MTLAAGPGVMHTSRLGLGAHVWAPPKMDMVWHVACVVFENEAQRVGSS